MSYLQRETSRVSWRAILVGLLLIPLNTYWIGMTETIWSSLRFTVASLPINVVFILLILVLINWLVKLISSRPALSPSELLTVYIILAASSNISGYDSIGALMGIIPHAFWYNTPENDWAALFHKDIPDWLVVSDRRIIRGFYDGKESFFTGANISNWIVPVLSWSAFIILLAVIMLLINVIIRKQWTEREKLTYPIIQLPLEMTNPKTQLFRNKLMWYGFAIVAFIDIVNGLNYLYPAIPEIPVRAGNLQTFFTRKPFNAMGSSSIKFRPFIIGLTYLLPWDLSFSCFFFAALGRASRVWGAAVGWSNIRGYPFMGHQTMGSLIGLTIIAFAGKWKYFLSILRKVITNKGEDDSREPVSYRGATVGLIVASMFLLAFCVRAGMSPWVFVVFFFLYFAMSLAITRIRAELGMPEHPFFAVTPQDSMIALTGTRVYGNRNLTVLAMFLWFNRRNRNNPMPHQLEGFKISEQAGISNKGIMWTMIIATIAGIIATFMIFPYLIYKYGAEARAGGMVGMGGHTFNNLSSWIYHPQATNKLGSGFAAGGVIFTLFLAIMRRQFIWWPFHPAGYAMGFSIDDFWFTILISSIIKVIVLKHGGARAYRKSIPFFLGLVLGDYVVACAWALLGIIIGKPMYMVWE